MSYVELHCHSAFSFADGASSPDELALAAAELGYESLALTDHDGLWGSMEFAQACVIAGVRPITGVELTVRSPGVPPPPPEFRGNCPPGAFHLTLLVESATGYRNLCRLLTSAHADERQVPSVPLPELIRNSEGLICLSGCARDGALAGRIARGDHGGAEQLGRHLLMAFGADRFRVELQRPLWRGDRARNRALAELAERLGVPCVATGNVHSHHRRRAALQDVLVAIRLNGTLESTEPERRGNGSATLLGPAEAAERFAEHPEAVAESGRLAERLRFDLTRDLGYSYPGSEDGSADRRLAQACAARFSERYEGTVERPAAERQLEDELRMIAKLGLSGFFLLHRDLLELARDVAVEVRGPDSARSLLPPGRGRGSSVSSIVCYLTGLSHVDPIKAGLFLGRFLNDEISEAPDIDLDFPRDVRERLIPRIHERYGHERSALVAAFPTFRTKGAIRDLGKALGLPAGEIERVARAASPYARYEPDARDGGADTLGPNPGVPASGQGRITGRPSDSLAEGVPGSYLCPDIAEAIGAQRAGSERWLALARLVEEAYGLPRHASQHSGGMVLSTRPLIDLCPIVPAAMEGRQIVQWDKDSCADAGFLKIDLLGLGMLSAVERTVNEIAKARSERIDLSRIPLDDPEVYAQIQRAETTGVFQIESRAQMQMLPRSLPENIDDLTVQVALVRPGPIQGGAVHPYLERKRKLREDPGFKVPYEHPSLEPILSDTLGAIVFQDQVIQVAMALSGFSSGEAEGLRRAMSRKRSDEAMRSYRDRFVEGAVAQGVTREVGERVYEQIRGFSGFGFPKSHAAAFGLLAYQSTWLRVHYGPEFLCALLNEQPMGFYPPDALVHEAQRRGIEIQGTDVNRSAVECRVEPGVAELGLAVRIGLGYVKGLNARDAEVVVVERERYGEYRDLGDLASRSGATADALERLAWAGACAAIGGSEESAPGDRVDRRRTPLWRLGVASGSIRQAGGEQLSLPLEVPAAPALQVQTPWERVMADYGSQGMALDEHPLELLRPGLDERTVTCADLERIADGTELTIAGMLVARQRPATAKGVMFLLIEDETGVVNVVVLPPVYDRHRLTVRTASLVTIEGRLERREGVVNVIAATVRRLERPDQPLAEVRSIEPPPERETGGSITDLDAVLPAVHSFGRRG